MAESKMAEFKEAAIIKLSEKESLSQIELVWVRVLCKMAKCKMAELKMAEFKMAAIIKLSQNEWVKMVNARWQNSRWLPSSS